MFLRDQCTAPRNRAPRDNVSPFVSPPRPARITLALALAASVAAALLLAAVTYPGYRNSRLAAAVEEGDADAAVHWLRGGADPNGSVCTGRDSLLPTFVTDRLPALGEIGPCTERAPVIVRAARMGSGGSSAVLAELLRRGAQVDAPGEAGDTALSNAAQVGDEAACAVLLSHGARPDGTPGVAVGYTPLFTAVTEGNVRIVRRLLAAGASPHPEDILQQAILFRHTTVIDALLDAGVDPDRTGTQGVTP